MNKQSTGSAADAARRTSLRRTVAAALALPLVAGAFMLQAGADDGQRLFYEVLSRVSTQGVDSVPEDRLYEIAARGLLQSIGDPYAELFSPEQLAEFQRESLRNGYGGMGMLVERVRDTTVVTRVYPHTPASGAGVRMGDRIVAVNGRRVVGLVLDSVTARLLGPAGTPVQVTFVRPGAGVIQHTVNRAVVHIPVVPYATLLEDGIGYVPLDGFSESSAEEITAALASLRKRGARSFVLDLRGNGGGSLDQSIRIANLFIGRGQKVLEVRYRAGRPEVYRSGYDPLVPTEPIAVLTDEGTASASEIVAGALQDHDRAVVVGMRSFGKGLVQDIFPLDGGWALKLTTAKWFTPSGRTIQRPRTLQADGSLEEDSLASTDSALAALPVFRSDAGRVVRGGGGVTPDLVVRVDTLEGAERALVAQLAVRGTEASTALSELSLEWARGAQPDFQVSPAWRAALYSRLRAAGVPVTPEAYAAGATLVDRMIANRVASLAFGDEAVFRRGIARDAQLQAALGLLRGAQTQREVWARLPAPAATSVAAQP
jgi:carboxyl-terminal processing protease